MNDSISKPVYLHCQYFMMISCYYWLFWCGGGVINE